MNTDKITIDVVSDIACPWCYVGKRRLEAALEQWKGSAVEVKWHPFQLDPNMSKEGINRDIYLKNKFGSIEKIQSSLDNLINAGKEEGIDFDFGENWLAVNTLHLHQLLEVAGQEGFKAELKERFLKGYFVNTEHLNDMELLYSILAEFGWSKEKVDAIVADETIAQKVKNEIKQYQEMGVTGVPFFIINNKYGISGAQPSSVFLDAFKKVSSLEIIADSESCDPETGNC